MLLVLEFSVDEATSQGIQKRTQTCNAVRRQREGIILKSDRVDDKDWKGKERGKMKKKKRKESRIVKHNPKNLYSLKV